MNPPWLDLLPIYEEGVTEAGVGIYTGSVSGLKNLCVQIAGDELHVLKLPETAGEERYFWYYNEEQNALRTTIADKSVNYAPVIVESAGFNTIAPGAGVAVPALFKDNVSFKIMPE